MADAEECEQCGGFGYLDDAGDRECPKCLGDGTVVPCDVHGLQRCERCESDDR